MFQAECAGRTKASVGYRVSGFPFMQKKSPQKDYSAGKKRALSGAANRNGVILHPALCIQVFA